ncbi:hypothetical protein GGQ87_001972 [Brevundimonas alba]|uniref:DUF1993 domain-containing protein n=1 Tax=Brevundimonas alba TaxID=74314 RepID=A0A7X5YLA1_9CAUL|nr:DUF1993 domain-containing protein [Brevundimonas alba]NJC41714.1 hypothetical protein [Brevundimonas alba]
MSLTNLLVPTCKQMLLGLSGLLVSAQGQRRKAEAEGLLASRLAPDMFPLAAQVRFACIQAQEMIYRLQDKPLPEGLGELAREAEGAGVRPGSISDAQGRIDETILLLEGLIDGRMDPAADRLLQLKLPHGVTFELTGEQYARDWLLPQFYFHVVTAYAILRSQGVVLGKAEYVPHMFAYARRDSLH